MSIPSISGGTIVPPLTQSAATATAPSAPDRASPARAEMRTPPPVTDRNADRGAPEDTQRAVQDAVRRANATIQALRSNLKFTVDEATGIDVVKFIDVKTEEVIRQIPSEEMLALARRLDELKGLLIKDKA